jgi:protein-tyrosine phosphatase
MAQTMGSTAKPWSRIVDTIPGAVNLRDFGGYPTHAGCLVRTGVLYRSGFTHGLSTEDTARLAGELGIRTVVDLRGEPERARGLTAFANHGIRTVHEPIDTMLGDAVSLAPGDLVQAIVRGDFDWVTLYWSILDLNGPRFARLLGMLTEPAALPILFHCSGGRDRTGVTVAIIQAALGVADEFIADDYAISSRMLALSASNGQLGRLFGDLDVPRDEVARALTTHPATMLALLARIRGEHGGFDALRRTWGVSDDTLSEVRAQLLE